MKKGVPALEPLEKWDNLFFTGFGEKSEKIAIFPPVSPESGKKACGKWKSPWKKGKITRCVYF